MTKLNANDYTTSMTGMKFKLAHRRSESDKWSASSEAQRKHLIKILQQVIHDLEQPSTAEAGTSPSPKAARSAPRARAAKTSAVKKTTKTSQKRAA